MSDQTELPAIVPAEATPPVVQPTAEAGKPAPGVKLAAAMPPAVADLNLPRRVSPETAVQTPVNRHSFTAKRPAQRVLAATGVPFTTAELPSFLKGPEAPVREVRHQTEKARTELAQLITSLHTYLPPAAAALQAVEDAQDGAQIAEAEGFDVRKARSLVDSLARLLKALK